MWINENANSDFANGFQSVPVQKLCYNARFLSLKEC
ncbi:hypothetical protein Pvag_pPag30432 (plasmid) [Pantoea vagans C9-1]|nr:hypothetical protein Pvag_pPag30432 [Pantoea vagans C9-1]